MRDFITNRTVADLSPRERQVVSCRCLRDMTIAETAYDLCLSPQTVKNHSQSILNKLGKHSMHAVCVQCGEERAQFEHVAAMRAGAA